MTVTSATFKKRRVTIQPVHISGLTCHLPIVLLQLVDLAPLGPILLVDMDVMVVGAQGDLWNRHTLKFTMRMTPTSS